MNLFGLSQQSEKFSPSLGNNTFIGKWQSSTEEQRSQIKQILKEGRKLAKQVLGTNSKKRLKAVPLSTQQLLLDPVSSEDENDMSMQKRKHVNLQIDSTQFGKKKDSFTTIMESSSPVSSILKSVRKPPKMMDQINEYSHQSDNMTPMLRQHSPSNLSPAFSIK